MGNDHETAEGQTKNIASFMLLCSLHAANESIWKVNSSTDIFLTVKTRDYIKILLQVVSSSQNLIHCFPTKFINPCQQEWTCGV